MTGQKDDVDVLFTGSVHQKFGEELSDEMGVGTYGLGAAPWSVIEYRDGKIYLDGKEQEAKE